MSSQLALTAAHVQHRRQCLAQQPTGDSIVDVLHKAVLVQDRAGQAKALGIAVVVRRDGLARTLAIHATDCPAAALSAWSSAVVTEARQRDASPLSSARRLPDPPGATPAG
jgi:hypothetical protein